MINSITENVFIIFLKIPSGGGGGGYNILAIPSGILYFFSSHFTRSRLSHLFGTDVNII